MADRLSSQQKEAIVEFMESHTDFANGRVSSPQAAKAYERLWERLRGLLHNLPGARKNVKGWKDYWATMRSNAKQVACSNGKSRNIPTGGGGPIDDEGVDEDEGFTTEDPLIDRIMNITGWHLAFGVGVEDDLEYLISNSSCSQNVLPIAPRSQPTPSNVTTPRTLVTYRNQASPTTQASPSMSDQLIRLMDRQSTAIAKIKSILDVLS